MTKQPERPLTRVQRMASGRKSLIDRFIPASPNHQKLILTSFFAGIWALMFWVSEDPQRAADIIQKQTEEIAVAVMAAIAGGLGLTRLLRKK